MVKKRAPNVKAAAAAAAVPEAGVAEGGKRAAGVTGKKVAGVAENIRPSCASPALAAHNKNYPAG